MAKDKERSINPAAAQRKAEKQKALKKGVPTLPFATSPYAYICHPDLLSVLSNIVDPRQSSNSSPTYRTLRQPQPSTA